MGDDVRRIGAMIAGGVVGLLLAAGAGYLIFAREPIPDGPVRIENPP